MPRTNQSQSSKLLPKGQPEEAVLFAACGRVPANLMRVTRAARHYGIPMEQIIVELTEENKVSGEELRTILMRHQVAGVATALDDFGAGYAGLNLMVACRPEILKVDRGQCTGSTRARCGRRSSMGSSRCAGRRRRWRGAWRRRRSARCALRIDLMQGSLFARPMIERAPVPMLDFCG